MGNSGAQGTLIYEKNLMSKISGQTPFKNLTELKVLINLIQKTFIMNNFLRRMAGTVQFQLPT